MKTWTKIVTNERVIRFTLEFAARSGFELAFIAIGISFLVSLPIRIAIELLLARFK